MKDERAQKYLEKKHPYENFNKEVGSVDQFVTRFFRLQDNVISIFQ